MSIVGGSLALAAAAAPAWTLSGASANRLIAQATDAATLKITLDTLLTELKAKGVIS